MPNINDAFPSKFLSAHDLRGAEPIVTMDRVAYEPVGTDEEMKAVLYFRGKDKGLVLNKTNAYKITELMRSAITEEWAGQKIRLFATETQFAGKTVPCIRVKAAPSAGHGSQPPQSTPAPPPHPSEPFVGPDEITDSDIPF